MSASRPQNLIQISLFKLRWSMSHNKPMDSIVECACKFIQCLTMQEDVHKLHAERFGEYRRKLAVDLIKWYRTPADNYAFKDVSCNLDKS
ncbi:hypothetical protein LIER_11931 [Lithospermum erythrorhizon]|uniref:Uncharacterized protein n=1 Tax=Lithospermum erythrorhizon TaxID=34254 RepID=A0AAV3PTX1_LITER